MPIVLRRGQGDGEGAVGLHHTGTDLATWALHGNGSACFAVAGQHGACTVDRHVGRRSRWLEVRRGEGRAARGVARPVGLADVQHLAIQLRCIEVDAELACGVDLPGAQHRIAGAAHGHGCARFAGAGQYQAIGRQRGDDRVCRRGDVCRHHEGRLRFAANQGNGRDGQLLPVELCSRQLQAERTVQGGAADTNLIACRVIYPNACSRRRIARQSQAIAGQHDIGRWYRRGCQRRDEGDAGRRIGRRIGLVDHQRRHRAGRRTGDDLEGPGLADFTGTDHRPVFADGNGCAWLATARDHGEGVVHRQVCDGIGRRGIPGQQGGRE